MMNRDRISLARKSTGPTKQDKGLMRWVIMMILIPIIPSYLAGIIPVVPGPESLMYAFGFVPIEEKILYRTFELYEFDERRKEIHRPVARDTTDDLAGTEADTALNIPGIPFTVYRLSLEKEPGYTFLSPPHVHPWGMDDVVRLRYWKEDVERLLTVTIAKSKTYTEKKEITCGAKLGTNYCMVKMKDKIFIVIGKEMIGYLETISERIVRMNIF